MSAKQSVFTAEDIQTIFNDFGVESIKTFYNTAIYIHPTIKEKLGDSGSVDLKQVTENLRNAPGVIRVALDEFGFPAGNTPEGYINYEYEEDDVMAILRRNQCCPFMICTEDCDDLSVVMTIKIKADQ